MAPLSGDPTIEKLYEVFKQHLDSSYEWRKSVDKRIATLADNEARQEKALETLGVLSGHVRFPALWTIAFIFLGIFCVLLYIAIKLP